MREGLEKWKKKQKNNQKKNTINNRFRTVFPVKWRQNDVAVSYYSSKPEFKKEKISFFSFKQFAKVGHGTSGNRGILFRRPSKPPFLCPFRPSRNETAEILLENDYQRASDDLKSYH